MSNNQRWAAIAQANQELLNRAIDKLRTAEMERDALRAALESLEWAPGGVPDNDGFDLCLVCRQWRGQGHMPDCALVPLLAATENVPDRTPAGAQTAPGPAMGRFELMEIVTKPACNLCGEPWLQPMHFCPPAAPPPPTTCPACGQPKGQGYGCAVPMSPVMPTEEWQVEHNIVLSTSYVLAQADSDAVVPSPVPECHCARILPVLRRWLLAGDATTGMIPADLPVDQVIALCDEAAAAEHALVVLAREVLGG